MGVVPALVCAAVLSSSPPCLRLRGGGRGNYNAPPNQARSFGNGRGWAPGAGELENQAMAYNNGQQDWHQDRGPPMSQAPTSQDPGREFGDRGGGQWNNALPFSQVSESIGQEYAQSYGGQDNREAWAGGHYSRSRGQGNMPQDGAPVFSGNSGGYMPSNWESPQGNRYEEQRGAWNNAHSPQYEPYAQRQPQYGSGHNGYGNGVEEGAQGYRRQSWSGGRGGGGWRGEGQHRNPQTSNHGGSSYTSGRRDWVQHDSWKGDYNDDRQSLRPVPRGELLHKIMNSKSRESLTTWILEVRRRSRNSMLAFHTAHILTALNRMTKLPNGGFPGESDDDKRAAKKRYYFALNSLFDRSKAMVPFLNARGVATVVHAVGALNRNDTEGLQGLVTRALEDEVRYNFTCMGFSNMVWALGKGKFNDRELMQQLMDMVYFGESPPAVSAEGVGGEGGGGEDGVHVRSKVQFLKSQPALLFTTEKD